ncbi:LysM peptidoglycan-binding domain-containing protein [Tumebacillus permanentifrigoris]|uniref:Spore germination protein YaaH n=1 Tax=Tumebacillus permanentifrigoris TaxID=378543 RepID=A0A316DYQ9_9BACL|nr:glycosyl hydrolase family 18 protein [Tumebacillus permanentifrigoris]PWK15640.1 spore germination protein YaaH [Tumebacillus permanentifrigoris]
MGDISTTQLHYVIVQEGDTLASIAERYQSTAGAVAQLNAMSPDTVLTPGRIVQVLKPKRPATVPAIPSPTPRPRTPRYAFAAFTGAEGVYPSSERALEKLGEAGLSGIFPLWFQVAPEEPWRLQSFAEPAQIEQVIRAAHERGVQVLAALTSIYYPSGVDTRHTIAQVLRTYKGHLLQAVEHTYERYHLDGVLLDWVDVEAADREVFAEWVEALQGLCRRRGWKLVVNVPIVQGTLRGITSTMAFDLARIGEAVDWMSLVLNTEHRMYTGPGPLCSLSWAEMGVRHAIATGVPAEKILLGIAGYAYDWKEHSQLPDYLSSEGAMNRARQYRAHVKFDPVSQTPMFSYQDSQGAKHQVWFENTSSLSQKVTIINRYGLAGLSLWRLGMEDSGLWPLLRYRWGEIRKIPSRFHNKYYEN